MDIENYVEIDLDSENHWAVDPDVQNCEELCLCIAHTLRAKVVNLDINYLCIDTVAKFEINLAYQ